MHHDWQSLGPNEVQVMSAGTGVQHSEINGSTDTYLSLFQIWIIPNELNVSPRYDQKYFEERTRKNEMQTLVTSINSSHSGSLKIHQNARISRIDLDKGLEFEYTTLSATHGVYVMNITGEIQLDRLNASQRDAIGVSETENFIIKANENSQLLLIEVPML